MTDTTMTPALLEEATPDGLTRIGGRPMFLGALRAGLYPVVPEGLSTAVAAMEHLVELERAVLYAPPEGLGVFCARVADEVLAGRGYPEDFARAAFEAQQAADLTAAQAAATAGVRNELDQRFRHVVAEQLPGLLGGLRAQIEDVLTQLKTVDQALGGLDMADPAAVARATADQRAALLAFNDLHRTYKVARRVQRTALEASSAPIPGWSDLAVGWGWGEVFAFGLHEFSDTREHGSPVGGFRALVNRPDVWVPTVAEMHEAWNRFHEPQSQPTKDDHPKETR